MKSPVFLVCLASFACLAGCRMHHASGPVMQDTLLVSDTIQYHAVRISRPDSSILPWYSPDRRLLL